MKLLLLFLLFSCSVMAAETGYRVIHPDGTVEFSDTPLPGGEKLLLREAPTIQFVPATPSPASQVQESKGTPAGSEVVSTLSITTPRGNETLWFDESGVTVTVAVTPALQGGQLIAITLDGKVVASGSGSSFNLGEVYRGTHTLSASIINAAGSVVVSSTPVTFHVRQHSSIKRPTPPDTSPRYAPILPE